MGTNLLLVGAHQGRPTDSGECYHAHFTFLLGIHVWVRLGQGWGKKHSWGTEVAESLEAQ